MNLYELLESLPLELFLKIRRMAYYTQPRCLLNDITNFYSSKNLIFDYYNKNKYINKTDEITTKKSLFKYFIEDIELYLNEGENPLFNDIKPKFKKTLTRYFKYKNETDEHLFRIIVFFMYYHKVEIEGIFLWGIMKIEERNKILKKYDLIT